MELVLNNVFVQLFTHQSVVLMDKPTQILVKQIVKISTFLIKENVNKINVFVRKFSIQYVDLMTKLIQINVKWNVKMFHWKIRVNVWIYLLVAVWILIVQFVVQMGKPMGILVWLGAKGFRLLNKGLVRINVFVLKFTNLFVG